MTSTGERTRQPAPVRFGILGAARIGPDALIKPAQSHPGAVVAAVACRDAARGTKYARKHSIPKTYGGPQAYQELISDPEIDAIYNPLPNGLHFEWTMRALQAGKHVLIEKPVTDTADEARQIFALAQERGLVALEAMHSAFHPAMLRVKEIIASGELGKVKSVSAALALPSVITRFFFLKDDVRYEHDLGGGVTMDMGVYPLGAIRLLTGTESAPLEVTSATPAGHPHDPDRIDRAMRTTYALPGDVTADSFADWSQPGWGPLGLLPRAVRTDVTVALEGGEIAFWNFVQPGLYHSIKVRSTKGKARTEKAYTYADGRGDKAWSSYRYQLEAFVDKVQGRTPWTWREPETSVTSMETIERIYTKAGLPPRVASSFKLDATPVA
ncbi:NAD-P-binding protein [Trametes elegans]|nr:NAD-P-binding protein [Trametes elegans]